MKGKIGIVFMLLGVLLIAGAVALLLHNRSEDERAGKAAEAVIPDVIDKINETIQAENNPPAPNQGAEPGDVICPTLPPHVNPFNEEEVLRSYEMTAVEIDGNEYIGYLSIPSLQLELPVMANWSYKKLRTAPCRQFGSVKSNDLVIVGHNYARHFRYIRNLQRGDSLIFTDMDGNTIYYTLLAVEQIEATDVASMLKDNRQRGEWDLTLYTCTYGGGARIAARFQRSEPAL